MEYREFRAEAVGVTKDGKLVGQAVPFNRETTIGDMKRGGWKEEVADGSTRKSITEGDVVFLAHHDMHQPLARMSAGNLELRETPSGLQYEADPVDTSYGRDIRALADAKVLGGVSIGFVPVKEEWRDEDGNPSDKYNGTHRILREIKLVEISAVTNPAYKDTSIMARDELLAERETRAGNPKPYGDVKYADPKNGKYPVDTEKHARAAWSYINMPKNAEKYPLNGVTLSEVKSRIKAALKHFGVEVEAKADDEPEVDPYADEFYENETPADEGRDDPDGKEYAAIDEALRQLKAGDVKGAEKTLAANQAQRAQEPESSTPEDDADLDFALRVAERERQERSRELGLV